MFGLDEALILLAVVVVAVPLFKRLGLGSVLGYLVAGVLIGPHGLGRIAEVDKVKRVADLGVVLLLLMLWIIDPKLKAISGDYEHKQKQYLEDLEKIARWEK